jgi:CO dehydrogenase maturation factor
MSTPERPKLAVAGKGGVGKTTISAALTLALAARGQPVLAVDGDSNGCLGPALGFTAEDLAALCPLEEMHQELEKRAKPVDSATYLLAPPVADLIDKYSLVRGDVQLLVMGTIGEAGSGCACGLNTSLREVLRQLVKRPEALVVDMEAGIEHMGRGTIKALQAMLIVAEPAPSSLRTCQRLVELAGQMGVQHLGVIANKVRNDAGFAEVERVAGPVPVLARVPFLEDLREPLTGPSASNEQLLGILSEALDRMPS